MNKNKNLEKSAQIIFKEKNFLIKKLMA